MAFAKAPSRGLDSKALRNALGTFATGVTVITTRDRQGKLYGITANSFSSVSLEPPLVLWSQALTSPSYPAFHDADRFGISILSEDQVEVSNRFARSGANKFEGVALRYGLGGVPLIEGAAAFLECVREASYPGGDHEVFLARVERIEQRQASPLVFASGKYMVAAHHDLRQRPEGLGVASLSHLNGVRLASDAARDFARSQACTIGVGVWGNHGPTIVRWEESSAPVSINLRTGLVLPVFGSATGLALAAFLPEQITDELVTRELSEANVNTACGNSLAAHELLGGIRRAGHAELVAGDSFTEFYGTEVSALSVPVFDRNDETVLVLTALGNARDSGRQCRQRTLEALCATASEVSQKLGYQPALPSPAESCHSFSPAG